MKQFNYRGEVREFSNRYCIGTTAPPDDAHWEALLDAIVLQEKTIYDDFSGGGAKIVAGVAYDVGNDVPVYSKSYSVDGTYNATGTAGVPGDCAALVRYSTPDRSTKNHPVYCFNYYHAMRASGGGGDTIAASQVTALENYATAWLTGFSDGTTTFHRSRPTGDLCTARHVPTLFTHRDLAH